MADVATTVRFTQKEILDIMADKAKELAGKGLGGCSAKFDPQPAVEGRGIEQTITVTFKGKQ